MTTEYVLAYCPNERPRFQYGKEDEVDAIILTEAVVSKAEVIGKITKRAIPIIFWNNQRKPYFNIIFSSRTTARKWLKENHPELKLGTNIFWRRVFRVTG